MFGEEQGHSLEELIAVERCQGQVEEEAIQDGQRNLLENVAHQQRQADEDVREKYGHTSFAYFNNTSATREREIKP